MRNNMLIITVVLILLLSINTALVSSDFKNNHYINDSEALFDVANSMKGDILGYSINGYLVLDQPVLKNQMEQIASEIFPNLGLTTWDFKSIYNTDSDTHYIATDWYYRDDYFRFTLDSDKEKSYLFLSVDLNSTKDIVKMYDLIEKQMIIAREVLNCQNPFVINTSIYKELPGTLTQVEVIEQMYLGFTQIGAKLVTDYKGAGKTMGFIGYSTRFENKVSVDGKKYNLHMAVYYDETTKQYYLTIANPIIETSY